MCRNAIKVSYSAAPRAILWLYIERMRSLVGFFLPSDWDFFGNWDILDWEWGLISDPGDREKTPSLAEVDSARSFAQI